MSIYLIITVSNGSLLLMPEVLLLTPNATPVSLLAVGCGFWLKTTHIMPTAKLKVSMSTSL